MRLLLDSDTLSELYDPSAFHHPAVAGKLSSLGNGDQAFISILAFYEMEFGYANAPAAKKPVIRQRILAAEKDFTVLPLTPEGGRVFGNLKAKLRHARQLTSRGAKSHNVDLMIAATAITEGCTLVGADAIYRDIQKLDPQLVIENWMV